MDLNDTPVEAGFRAEVASWLSANAGPYVINGKMSLADEAQLGRRWQAHKAKAGYGAIHWDRELGGLGASGVQLMIFREEEGRYLLPTRPYVSIGLGLAMPTLFTHASKAIVERFARPTLEAEITWCQLFSEPAAGSDLAAVTTRAVRTGGGWIVNGQKVWNSFATFADWGILLARSDFGARKHQGLSFFVLDMRSPGVEVRPIKQMTGGAEFCEVFLTDVLIPEENQIGQDGEGWRIALTTLSNERFGMGAAGRHRTDAQTLVRLAREADLDGSPAIEDSAVRERIAYLHARERGAKFFGYRLTTRMSRGEPLGAEVSVNKLVAPRLAQEMGELALELCGYSGLIEDDVVAPDLRVIHDAYLLATAHRIAGGTDEIMRNQIAEKVLGLPQDVRLDKGVPFNELT